MKLGEKIKFIKKGKEIYKTFKTVKESKETVAGMSLWEFMQKIRTDPDNTLSRMTTEEILNIFNKDDAPRLYKVMPKLEDKVKEELKRRDVE